MHCGHYFCGACMTWVRQTLYTFEDVIYGGARKLGLAKWGRKNGDEVCGGSVENCEKEKEVGIKLLQSW